MASQITHLCTDIMLRLALMQPDLDDRAAMLQIMRDDGAITAADFARLVG